MVTVVSHDVFEGGHVIDRRLIPAEDLSSRAEVIGEIITVRLPHLLVAAHQVNLTVERNVI